MPTNIATHPDDNSIDNITEYIDGQHKHKLQELINLVEKSKKESLPEKPEIATAYASIAALKVA